MRKYYSEITNLRGAAIIMVLIYHSILVYPVNLHDIAWCDALSKMLWYIQMPLFFLVSGFCYSYHNNYRDYAWKKVKRILIPHLIFGAIDLTFRILPSYIPSMSGLVNQKMTFKSGILDFLLYGGEDPFLRALFVLVMLFPLLDCLFRKWKWSRIPVYMLVIAGYIWNEKLTGMMAFQYMMSFMPYFCIGYELARCDYDKVKKFLTRFYVPLMALILGIVATYVCFTFGYERYLSLVIALCGAILFYFIFAKINNVNSLFGKLFTAAGNYSLQLYLLDGYILVISRKIIVGLLGIENAACIILLNFVTDLLIMLLLILLIINKVKLFRFLCGIPDKNKKGV